MRFFAVGLALSVVTSIAVPVGADCGAENPVGAQMANEADQLRNTNLDAAIDKYREAHEAAPTNHRILAKLASAYQKKEAWDQVAATLAKAIALAPKHATYVRSRGFALARQAEKGSVPWTEVKTVLEQAVALDPNLPDAHFELAEAEHRLHHTRSALVHYTKAIELAPDRLDYYANLGDYYQRLGFEAEAERTLTAGEAQPGEESKKFALYSLHGDLLSNRGDHPGAISLYERAKKACGQCNEPGQQIAFFNLGAAYAMVRPARKSEAMANLQAFVKMICKGAAAARYADTCMQAQQLATNMGGSVF